MALDRTAKDLNVTSSLKKFFVDNIKTTEGVPILFDKSMANLNLVNKTISKWAKK